MTVDESVVLSVSGWLDCSTDAVLVMGHDASTTSTMLSSSTVALFSSSMLYVYALQIARTGNLTVARDLTTSSPL